MTFPGDAGGGALHEALLEVDRARAARDDLRLDHANFKVDQLLDQARAAHAPAATPAPDWGAGARPIAQADPHPMNTLLRAQRDGIHPAHLIDE
jgi:hypothetical protein